MVDRYGKYDCGCSYHIGRGGTAVPGNSWGTWCNNDGIQLFDINHLNGNGWLDNGYYPMPRFGKKEINIFLDGGTQQRTSWWGGLLGGGINLGLNLFTLWGFGRLFGGRARKQAPAQPTLTTNKFATWYSTPLFHNAATTPVTPAPTTPTPAQSSDSGTGTRAASGNASSARVAAPAASESSPAKTYKATASNGTNEVITGNVTDEGELNEEKYPKTFTITDKQHNNDGNKYTFTFVQVNDNEQPIYQCTEFNGKTRASSIKGVKYTVTSGITKGANDEYHISKSVIMDAIKGTGTQVIHKDEVENATETKTLTANNTTIK